ncbi:hypothetical protein FC169_21995, partial [Salmonella enterica]|nr:hypothetical protein [Salmonella enterica]EAT9282704.1 hypothetical protein [Salmonella enterica]
NQYSRGIYGETPGRKKERQRFLRQPHRTRELTHDCVEKMKILFPQLRAEGCSFLPLKIRDNCPGHGCTEFWPFAVFPFFTDAFNQ